MTTTQAVKRNVGRESWRASRTPHSLLRQMAKEAEQAAAQGERLRELKQQARGTTFRDIADACHVTERQAQRWFAGESDPGPESLKALAEFFGTTPDYIEYGQLRRPRADTPPLMDEIDGDRFSRIEAKLDELLDRLASIEVAQGVSQDEIRELRKTLAEDRRKAA